MINIFICSTDLLFLCLLTYAVFFPQRQSTKQQSLKDKLKERKERRRHKSAVSGLSDQEEQEFLASDVAEESADAALLNASILAAVEDIDNEEKKKLVSSLVRNTEMSEDEKRELLDKFMAEAEQLDEQYRTKQEYNNAIVAAKLAARKRIRDEKLRENALKKELDALSARQVNISELLCSVDEAKQSTALAICLLPLVTSSYL